MSATLRPTPVLAALLLAAAGGLGAWLAFPPHDLWPLLPVALAMLSASVLTARAAWAPLMGLIWGFALFLPLTSWADIYAGLGPWSALALVEGAYIAGFAMLARTIYQRRGITLTSGILVACLWTGVEALRSNWPWGGLPWGASAFALQDSPLLNLGPWIGTAGLAFVCALLGHLLLAGGMALAGRRLRRSAPGGLWALVVAAVLTAACIVVPMPRSIQPEDPTMRIAGIQGNVPAIDPQDIVMPDEIFSNSLDLTIQAAADARTSDQALDLVVWPEDSTGHDPREDAVRGAALTDAASQAHAPILVGTQTLAPGDLRYNMSLLWEPDGTVSATYAKRHPVPFGEYIPARSFFRALSDKVDLVSVDMAPGTEVGVMDVGEHRVGVLICFEIAYETLVQDVVDAGAQVIVVQTNTALFGESDEAVQQLAEARVLSVVSGRSIVQAATVGESAIVTPDGHVLAHTGHWVPGTVTADVPLYTGTTPAVAAGPWIAIGLSALGLAGWLLAMASPRRHLVPPRTAPKGRR